MTWPPAGHDRQRELFSDDGRPSEPGKTLDEQVEGDHAYRDEPPVEPHPDGPQCPACPDHGHHVEEDQYRCENPRCRVSIFEGHGQTGGRR